MSSEGGEFLALHHHTSAFAHIAACPRVPLVISRTAPWFWPSKITSAISGTFLPCTSTCSTICGFFVLLFRCFIQTFCPVPPNDTFGTYSFCTQTSTLNPRLVADSAQPSRRLCCFASSLGTSALPFCALRDSGFQDILSHAVDAVTAPRHLSDIRIVKG